MKRARLWLLLVPVVLAVPLWFVARERRNSAEYLLGRYSPEQGFASVVTHSKEIEDDGTPFRLCSTWFATGRVGKAHYLFANSDGQMGLQDSYDGEFLDGTWSTTLNTEKVVRLLNATRQLPPNVAPARRDRVLIVTVCREDACQTRLYDRAHLPSQVREIYRITGAPLEEAKP